VGVWGCGGVGVWGCGGVGARAVGVSVADAALKMPLPPGGLFRMHGRGVHPRFRPGARTRRVGPPHTPHPSPHSHTTHTITLWFYPAPPTSPPRALVILVRLGHWLYQAPHPLVYLSASYLY
jgi:hypothetical protein